MKTASLFLSLFFFFNTIISFAQDRTKMPKVVVTGNVIEKASKTPLEYSTITFKNNKNPKIIFGGITNPKGEFSVEVMPGSYDIIIEFISFKSITLSQKKIIQNTSLGTISLEEDATQLKEVVVKTEKAAFEIKLDKKVYNVGQDLTSKGGTASDVLDNVPSVTVDGDGNVSLRGNDNVKIFIDGRPSTSINIADALKSISADSLDRIEVITNPSSKYDAEGGAGIINIVLKKGKNQGVNGTLIGTVGDPRNYNVSGTINYKTQNFNLFSSLGYQDSKSRGKTINNTNYTDPSGTLLKSIDENIERQMGRIGFNYGLGADWFLDKSTTWTNSFSYRKAQGNSPINDDLNNNDPANSFYQNRFTDQYTKTEDIEYTSNFTKQFKKDGHNLSLVFTTSKNKDYDTAVITNSYIGAVSTTTTESTGNFQNQSKNLIQADYALPIGQSGKLETGYKGDFNTLLTNFSVGSIDALGVYTPYNNYTNIFDYKEKFNAIYAQFGSKFRKFNYLFGMRYEDSNIDINLLTTNDFKNKRYHNFFPSAFLNYELNENTTLSLNYSKRIARPRYRFLSPFSNYSSNINIFQGNTDINPSLTDVVELSLLKKINKTTITSTVYYNYTTAPFQFIRRPNGETVSNIVNNQTVITPVTIATPVNLDTDVRVGLEFNANYAPFKWWKLNGNFNIFQSRVKGTYNYTLIGSNTPVYQTTDISAGTWFAKINSRWTLPFKVECQTNATYNAAQNTPQGKSLAVLAANLAFSKDVLKEKATITLNINDVFNSRKRISETNLATLNSYNEMQMRVRQINLTFTYRFNVQKSEKEKEKRPKGGSDDNGDFPG